MKRSIRKLSLLTLSILFLSALLWTGLQGRGAAPLAAQGSENAFLPVIFSPALEGTATPTATSEGTGTVTATSTATATSEFTPSATATIQASETATATATATASATATATVTATASSTATATGTMTPTATGTLETPVAQGTDVYLPIIAGPPEPALEVPIPVSKQPPIDFDAESAAAWANGQDLAFNKIGFHIQIFGSRAGLSDYIEELDAAGVPAVLKTANDAEYLFKAQELAQVSGVEHVLIYRDTTHGRDIPNYALDPITAARLSWAENRLVFPPELDPAMVWMETTNEPDRTKSAWLAEFALEQAKLAVREGARFAAFGWAGGEPEPENWESPEMLEFLAYAAQHPDQVAVALHEYSGRTSDIGFEYPFRVGRFQALFEAADKHGIARPTVLITEWGWEHNHVPEPQKAMEDIQWAAWLYAAYPQVKGAAIWTLGEGGGEFGDIGDEAIKLVEPVQDYSLGNFFLYSPGTRPIDADALAPSSTPPTPTPTATTDPNVTPTVTSTPTNTPTATVAPTADPNNPLANGSFEDGWETIQFGNQRPNEWDISWVQPGDPLYDSPDLASGVCECVHKLENQLPPSERPGGSDPLILDGTVTYKIFNAAQSFGTQLHQTISGLPVGAEYTLSVPLRTHLYGDTDPFGAEAGVWVDGVGDWSNGAEMGDRKWCKHELTFTVPSDGSIDIDVRVKSKYQSTKDFFMDDFRLVPSNSPELHPQFPLCDPTPETQQYRPYRWWLSWLLGA
jgi:hypothetical protein